MNTNPDFDDLVLLAKKIIFSLLKNQINPKIRGRLILLLTILHRIENSNTNKLEVNSGILLQLMFSLLQLLIILFNNIKN